VFQLQQADRARPSVEASLDDLRPERHRRAWRIFLLCSAVGIGVYQLTPVGIWRDAIYQLFGLSSAAAIVAGVRMHRPARRLPWYLMAAGQLLWSLADAVFSWDATIMGRDRFPSPADPFYLAGYPMVAAGLYLLIRGRRPRRDVAGFLDSAVLTVGLGLLSWVLLARPTIANYHESVAAAAVAAAYPVADILLFGLLIRLITTPGGRTASLRLLVVAMVLLIIVDTAASTLDLLTFDSTAAINFLWLASYAAWGAAALTPSMYALSEPTTSTDIRFSRKRLAALTLAVLVAPGTLVAQYLVGVPVDIWAVAIGSVAMFLLVVARMNLAITQIIAANGQRAQAQDALAHQAAHDALTGLPNRRQVVALIAGALSRAQRSGAVIGLLFIDLDGFKKVNDTLGHAAGDELLRIVGTRLQAAIRAGDVVARLGGDEFVVLLEPLDEQASAVHVADRVVAAISGPIILPDGREASVGASVGVAVSQDGANDPDVLLHEADVAVYRAKHYGRGRTEVFDASLRQDIRTRNELQTSLSAAMAGEELVLHYQPILHVPSGDLQGYEALVRWIRPGIGMVPPADFIPMAEQSDLICDLDAWVLRHAIQQLARWNEQTGTHDLVMAVNVSGRHIARPRIVADVRDALSGDGIDASQLVLEITETALIDDPVALTNLAELRRIGVGIAIDDFGTGYSSIARLEDLPVDIIKIDRRFLDHTTKFADKLLKLIVQTAHALDLAAIAEGVENEQQLKLLASINCESAQGYYLGRPLDAVHINAQGHGQARPLLRMR
jgi:diguanylate cyclase (GGDEF)-like protein